MAVRNPRRTASDVDYRRTQEEAWNNKLAKGFNTTDVDADFMRLVGEIGEANEAHDEGKSDYREELADVSIFLAGIAEMTGVDLQHEIEAGIASVFTTRNVPRDFMRLVTRVGQAWEAHQTGRPDYGRKLADVASHLGRIARSAGVDLRSEVEAKLAKNRQREYVRLPNGSRVKREPDISRHISVPMAAETADPASGRTGIEAG